MNHKTAAQIRQEFIDYFVQKCGHTFVPSSPCVPHDDPTLMFTNAGMNQFKDVFLGTGTRPFKRAANTQKCIRAGGKHNDLDDVGHDTYHHTFFEMLGNWSFGDYFKKEAIAWAWDLLTNVWGVDPQRLHATYFQGDPAEGLEPDSEARELWLKILPPERVHPGNKKDNFWEMGDTGPCGPCSEIHIDLTPDKSGGPLVNAGDARVMEVWNLVFIQFNRAADGKLSPLPSKHVDTGMGFERITSLLQGKTSNYDTDIFTPIFAAIQRVTGAPAYTGRLEVAAGVHDNVAAGAPAGRGGSDQSRDRKGAPSDSQIMVDVAYRVIADHLRTLTFALTDGATPSNEGRGYVLRRILRRAVRYGRQYLGAHEPFICKLIPAVVECMGESFPELKKSPQHVAEIIRDEEQSFIKTLDRGIKLFEEAVAASEIDAHDDGWMKTHRARVPQISGEVAFRLHDTFGFPIDLTEVMASERGMTVDLVEYERLMEEARERARGKNPFKSLQKTAQALFGSEKLEWIRYAGPTKDSEKYFVDDLSATLEGFVKFDTDGSPVYGTTGPEEGEDGGLIVDVTCFYAEQGGQVGDTGFIRTPTAEFEVEQTVRTGDTIVHFGTVTKGKFQFNDKVTLEVNAKRELTKKNHTATHVMNWALREVLGDHVQQKGSLVDPEKTRFDFSHSSQVTDEQLARIEEFVNAQIEEDLEVFTTDADQKKAREVNTLRAVFGEKYPDRVRVVSIGVPVEQLLDDPTNDEWMRYSVEFCGGTHVKRTSEIGRFRLIEESAVAKGIRRVTGITAERAAAAERAASEMAGRLADAAKCTGDALPDIVAELNTALTSAEIPVVEKSRLRTQLADLQERAKKAAKQQAKAGAADMVARADQVLASALRVAGIAVIAADMGMATIDQLRSACDSLRSRAGSAGILLAAESDGKVLLLAAMTPDVIAKGLKAGDLIKEIAPLVGGKGGGKPDLAQGGGTDVGKIGEAISAATAWIKGRLA